MFKKNLSLVYCLLLNRSKQRSHWLEQYLGCGDRIPLSSDNLESELAAYETLFSVEHRANLESLYVELLTEMSGKLYEQCIDVINALSFLQEVIATALWKYRLDVGTVLEEFARNFDRLDIASERVRLHQQAQIR